MPRKAWRNGPWTVWKAHFIEANPFDWDEVKYWFKTAFGPVTIWSPDEHKKPKYTVSAKIKD